MRLDNDKNAWLAFAKTGVSKCNFSTMKIYVYNNENENFQASAMGLAVFASRRVLEVLMFS